MTSSSVLIDGVMVSLINLKTIGNINENNQKKNLSKSFSSGPSAQNFVYAGIEASVKLSRFENTLSIGSPSPPE